MNNLAPHRISYMNRQDLAHFDYQKPAKDHAKENPGFRVFVRESYSTLPSKKSSRKFISGELTKFLLAYNDVEDKIKNFYELISEGHPCRLYFDLEFDRNDMDKDKDQITIFIDLVIHCLDVKFSVS